MQPRKIIDTYIENGSIIETAKTTGTSTVKVRKILITEGLWKSATSEKIRVLLDKGMSTEEIAGELHMSLKNVQAYMPYERGVYGGEEPTSDAMRSEIYRKRMKQAAAMQVVKNKTIERGYPMEKNKKSDVTSILKLHVELNLKNRDANEMRILHKYAFMEKSISREILVPADITLHALNYAILRMFGWQNGHLHSFSLPEDVFEKITENNFATWSKFVGIYFRFPTENYEDIYWDDDYREGESIKSWMKKKYTGPYMYNGYGEHYLMNQMEVSSMFQRWDEITVREFVFRAEKQPDPYKVKLKEASIRQVTSSFADVFCHELIERIPLSEIICTKNDVIDLEKIKTEISEKVSKLDINCAIEEYGEKRFSSYKKEREYLENYNIATQPITNQLVYRYDYGDGWEVIITCENRYEKDATGEWKDMEGKRVDFAEEHINEVSLKHRPICIARDGIELVDDVGGVSGFCRMLETIYEADLKDEDEREEHDSMLNWAFMMGWTGRNISPKQTL